MVLGSSPIKNLQHPSQCRAVDIGIDDHPTIITDYNLHATVSDWLTNNRTGRQLRIGKNHRRYQIRNIDAAKASFAKIPPPGKQQGGRDAMPASRRRHLPMTSMALFDDPKLLLKAPTSPPASVDHFQTTNLMRTIRMPSHKDSQHQITRRRKAAYAG
jgi:hypothetical protein